MLDIVLSTFVGVLAGGTVTWLVARHYARDAAGEFRLITRALAMAVSRSGIVNIQQDQKGKIVHIQIDDKGASMATRIPWWRRVPVWALALAALLVLVAVIDLYLGWRNGAFDGDPCSRWDWIRFKLTIFDCIR